MQTHPIIKIESGHLKEKGRLQYFYHSPSSKLPIRDVMNEQGAGYKTEPHIEMGGENFLKTCFQSSIRSHALTDERYLFLMTTCRNQEFPDVYGTKSIVGYIDKKGSGIKMINGKEARFVFGETYMYPFGNAIPITELGYNWWTRLRLVDEADTSRILERFSGLDNILHECIDEIERLDPSGKTCMDNKSSCFFKDVCKRY